MLVGLPTPVMAKDFAGEDPYRSAPGDGGERRSIGYIRS